MSAPSEILSSRSSLEDSCSCVTQSGSKNSSKRSSVRNDGAGERVDLLDRLVKQLESGQTRQGSDIQTLTAKVNKMAILNVKQDKTSGDVKLQIQELQETHSLKDQALKAEISQIKASLKREQQNRGVEIDELKSAHENVVDKLETKQTRQFLEISSPLQKQYQNMSDQLNVQKLQMEDLKRDQLPQYQLMKAEIDQLKVSLENEEQNRRVEVNELKAVHQNAVKELETRQTQQFLGIISSLQRQYQDMSDQLNVQKLQMEDLKRAQLPQYQLMRAEIHQLKASLEKEEQDRRVEVNELKAAHQNAVNWLESSISSHQDALWSEVEKLIPSQGSMKEDVALIVDYLRRNLPPKNLLENELNRVLGSDGQEASFIDARNMDINLQFEERNFNMFREFEPNRILEVRSHENANFLVNNPLTELQSRRRELIRRLEEQSKLEEARRAEETRRIEGERRMQQMRIRRQEMLENQRREELQNRRMAILGVVALTAVTAVNPVAGLLFMATRVVPRLARLAR